MDDELQKHLVEELNDLQGKQLEILLKAEDIRFHLASMGPIQSLDDLTTLTVGHSNLVKCYHLYREAKAAMIPLQKIWEET